MTRVWRYALLAAGILGTIPSVRAADIANGHAEILFNVNAVFWPVYFPANFTTLDGGSHGSGFLYSDTVHGNLDFKTFPTAPAYTKASASTGDFENSNNIVTYGYAPDFPTIVWIEGGTTHSESQATSSGTLAHIGDSSTYTTVWQTLKVTRNAGSGLVSDPIFNVKIYAPANALHVKAEKEGNASALASIKIRLVGSIKNNNVAGFEPVGLPSKDITSLSVTANDEKYSPAFDVFEHLDLPAWTRFSGANFDLDLGLRLEMDTRAEAVPEPGSLAAMGLGLALLNRRRTRRKLQLKSQL
jgi:hypothetical protein